MRVKITFVRIIGVLVMVILVSKSAAAESSLDAILSDVQRTLENPPPTQPTQVAPAQKTKPATSADSERTIPESFKSFFQTMWQNQISNDPSDWAADFAPYVSYSYAPSGTVSRAFILNDRAKLINRYPVRSYELISVDITSILGNRITGVWRFSYNYRGARKNASGRATVRFTAEEQYGRWQFISYHEDVARD